MGIEFSLDDVRQFLAENGLTLPSWVIGIAMTIIIAQHFGVFTLLGRLPTFFRAVGRFLGRFGYDQETKRFIQLRNRFAEHLISEIKQLNRESDWNDFYYIQLDATVEVARERDYSNQHRFITFLRFLTAPLVRLLFNGKRRIIKKNLARAVRDSSARTFLVVGDPGAGKTVSLRHLFLHLAQRAAKSSNKQTVLPVYLNLKSLNIAASEITAEHIRQWILTQIGAGQDRLIHDFLDNYFEKMLDTGQLFFLFDSFDEIPAVIDAHEETGIVRAYALALQRFLTAPHGCSGLISSRPYRAPKIFVGQRLTIRLLDNKRIRDALGKYLTDEKELFQQVWGELITNKRDLLVIARNPFYLSLIARYVADQRTLPARYYELFEHFVKSRILLDEQRLTMQGLSSEAVIRQTTLLAYRMLQTDEVGLEVTSEKLSYLLQPQMSQQAVAQLLSILTRLKFGTLSSNSSSTPAQFSFVHRRFHEYFCALYLVNDGRSLEEPIPYAELMQDNRWREVLVLLCEILPVDELSSVFEIARATMETAYNDSAASHKKRAGIETLRFLKDGFRSRLADLPASLRAMCVKFIRKQLLTGNVLDQKRAAESISLANDDHAAELLSIALESDSTWVQETGIESCGKLEEISPELEEVVRKKLFELHKRKMLLTQTPFSTLQIASHPTFAKLARYQRNLRRYNSAARYLFIPTLLLLIFLSIFYDVVPDDVLSDVPFFELIPKPPINFFAALLFGSGIIMGVNLLLQAIVFDTKNFFSDMLLSIVSADSRQKVKKQLILAMKWGILFFVTVGILILGIEFSRRYNFNPEILLLIVFSVIGIGITIIFRRRMRQYLKEKVKELVEAVKSLVVDIPTTFKGYKKFWRDVGLLARLRYQSETRPKTAQEACEMLHALDAGMKLWFVRNLSQWELSDPNPEPILQAAQGAEGELRDALFQLVEMWEDSAKA